MNAVSDDRAAASRMASGSANRDRSNGQQPRPVVNRIQDQHKARGIACQCSPSC